MKKEIFKIIDKELENIAGGNLTPEEAGVGVIISGGRSLSEQDVRDAISQNPELAAKSAGEYNDKLMAVGLVCLGVAETIVGVTSGVIGWVIGRKSGKAKAEREMTKNIVLGSVCASRRV